LKRKLYLIKLYLNIQR